MLAEACPPTNAVAARQATGVLRAALKKESGWTKIHAAEALIACGRGDLARSEFVRENESRWTGSAQIGFWRVQAQCAPTEKERTDAVASLERVLLDRTSPLRLYALESLCKLGFRFRGQSLKILRELGSQWPAEDAVFVYWALLASGDHGAFSRILVSLNSDSTLARARAGYILRWSGERARTILAPLEAAANREPPESVGFAIMASSILLLDSDSPHAELWRARLKSLLLKRTPSSFQACLGLMEGASREELPVFLPLLASTDADTRIGGAWSILTITAKH